MTAAKEALRCIGGWCDVPAGSPVGVCRAFRQGEEGCVGDVFLDFECGAGRCDRFASRLRTLPDDGVREGVLRADEAGQFNIGYKQSL